MRRKAGAPAGIPCDRNVLAGIYRRQFDELAPLRRHIFSLLPLRRLKTVFEPGCGTGLLGMELKGLTDADYTGMDIDPYILPEDGGFLSGDALRNPPAADLYIASFFFSSVRSPSSWLRKVRRRMPAGGIFALFGEYDYSSIEESPDMGVSRQLAAGLRRSGLWTHHGGRLDRCFSGAGFSKFAGGEVIRGRDKLPDRDFLRMHVRRMPDHLPQMSWRIVWGVWRKRPSSAGT